MSENASSESPSWQDRLARAVPGPAIAGAFIILVATFVLLVVALIVALASGYHFRFGDGAIGLVDPKTQQSELLARIEALEDRPAPLGEDRVREIAEEALPEGGYPTAEAVRDAFLESEEAQEAIKGDPGEPGSDVEFPPGAVVAFDGAQYHRKAPDELHSSGCPVGWIRFLEAKGRFIIGGSPPGEKGYDLWTKGGLEEFKIGRSELPHHSHVLPLEKFALRDNRRPPPFDDNFPTHDGSVITSSNERSMISHGIGTMDRSEHKQSLHNNMPPYIALYFCKKEG